MNQSRTKPRTQRTSGWTYFACGLVFLSGAITTLEVLLGSVPAKQVIVGLALLGMGVVYLIHDEHPIAARCIELVALALFLTYVVMYLIEHV